MPEIRIGPEPGVFPLEDELIVEIRRAQLKEEGEYRPFHEGWAFVRGEPQPGEMVVHRLVVDDINYYLVLHFPIE